MYGMRFQGLVSIQTFLIWAAAKGNMKTPRIRTRIRNAGQEQGPSSQRSLKRCTGSRQRGSMFPHWWYNNYNCKIESYSAPRLILRKTTPSQNGKQPYKLKARQKFRVAFKQRPSRSTKLGKNPQKTKYFPLKQQRTAEKLTIVRGFPTGNISSMHRNGHPCPRRREREDNVVPTRKVR